MYVCIYVYIYIYIYTYMYVYIYIYIYSSLAVTALRTTLGGPPAYIDWCPGSRAFEPVAVRERERERENNNKHLIVDACQGEYHLCMIYYTINE